MVACATWPRSTNFARSCPSPSLKTWTRTWMPRTGKSSSKGIAFTRTDLQNNWTNTTLASLLRCFLALQAYKILALQAYKSSCCCAKIIMRACHASLMSFKTSCFVAIVNLASLFCLADAYPRLNCVNVGLRQSSEASAERTSDPNHLFALKALGLKNLA